MQFPKNFIRATEKFRAVKLIAGAMASAIIEGREGQMGAAAIVEDDAEEETVKPAPKKRRTTKKADEAPAESADAE